MVTVGSIRTLKLISHIGIGSSFKSNLNSSKCKLAQYKARLPSSHSNRDKVV